MSRSTVNDVKLAIANGDLENLQYVMLDIVDIFDKAALLIYAVKQNHRATLRVLLDAGCDPCLKYEGRTALYWAVIADDTETLDLLLSDILWLVIEETTLPWQPLPVGNNTANDNTSCFTFCGLGSVHPKRSELEKLRFKVQRAINTALFEAVCHVKLQCTQRLLESGAAVNQFHYHDDEILSWCSPLIGACAAPVTMAADIDSTVQVIELLVSYGADISCQNCYGQSALHWASRASLNTVLPLLLRNGADIDMRDKQGQTPIMGACDRGDAGCLSVCRLLMNWGADVSCRGTKDDYSAFHFAVGNNNHDVVQLFLESGVCPTTGARFVPLSEKHCGYEVLCYDDPGTWQQLTPLDIAVNNNQLQMVKLLLSNYADINAPSHYNQTTGGGIIYLASESVEVTELLIRAGLERNAITITSRNRHLRPAIKELLKLENARPPAPLAHLTRLFLRELLARRYKRVGELPLPKAMINYINMDDLLT